MEDLTIGVFEKMKVSGREKRVLTEGYSMLPSIFPGSVLTVEPVNPARVEPGDVLCYIGYDKRIYAHRVLDRRVVDGKPHYVMKGDSQSCEEFVPVTASAFVVTEVEYGPFFYQTDGPLGRLFARIALNPEIDTPTAVRMAASIYRTVRSVRSAERLKTTATSVSLT